VHLICEQYRIGAGLNAEVIVCHHAGLDSGYGRIGENVETDSASK